MKTAAPKSLGAPERCGTCGKPTGKNGPVECSRADCGNRRLLTAGEPTVGSGWVPMMGGGYRKATGNG